MGTPLVKVTVVAKVCRAKWVVRFLLILQRSAISLRWALDFWLLNTGITQSLLMTFGWFLYFSMMAMAVGNIKEPSYALNKFRASEGVGGAGGSRTTSENPCISGLLEVVKFMLTE